MPTIPLDPQGRLNADVPCVTCGYNLRAADPTGNCPECGTPVETSARGDLLLFADQAWLACIHSGLGWLLAGVPAGVLLGVILIALAEVPNLVHYLSPRALSAVRGGLYLAVYTVQLIAWLKLTSLEPRPVQIERFLSARRVARAAACMVFTASVLGQILIYTRAIPPASAILYHWLGQFVLVLTTLLVIAGLIQARMLARRIPAAGLARNAHILIWGYSIASIGTGLMRTLPMILLHSPTSMNTVGSPGITVLTFFAFPWYAAYLFFLVWGLYFAHVLRLSLGEVLQKAAANSSSPIRNL